MLINSMTTIIVVKYIYLDHISQHLYIQITNSQLLFTFNTFGLMECAYILLADTDTLNCNN